MQQDARSPPWRLLPWPRPRPTASLPFPALAVAEPPLLQTALHLRPAVMAPCTAFPRPCFPPLRAEAPWVDLGEVHVHGASSSPPVHGCQPLLPFCPTAQQLCAPPPMDAQKFQQQGLHSSVGNKPSCVCVQTAGGVSASCCLVCASVSESCGGRSNSCRVRVLAAYVAWW
jgi:hypothetical protein